jgi:hypothetical protein
MSGTDLSMKTFSPHCSWNFRLLKTVCIVLHFVQDLFWIQSELVIHHTVLCENLEPIETSCRLLLMGFAHCWNWSIVWTPIRHASFGVLISVAKKNQKKERKEQKIYIISSTEITTFSDFTSYYLSFTYSHHLCKSCSPFIYVSNQLASLYSLCSIELCSWIKISVLLISLAATSSYIVACESVQQLSFVILVGLLLNFTISLSFRSHPTHITFQAPHISLCLGWTVTLISLNSSPFVVSTTTEVCVQLANSTRTHKNFIGKRRWDWVIPTTATY